MAKKEIDVVSTLRLLEWLKCQLTTAMSDLFFGLFKGACDGATYIEDSLSGIIVICYLIGKRTGISYKDMDEKVKDKIRLGIREKHQCESKFGDLTELSRHIK